jgi:Flagellar P-ring protein
MPRSDWGQSQCAAPILDWSTAGRLWLAAVASLLLVLAGCSLPALTQQTPRAQASEEVDHYDLKTIGDVTVVANPEPVRLGGVGLVTGLEGTGGETAPNYFRSMLEEHLTKQGVTHVKDLISSPNVAVVVVEAQLPSGTRKGDPIDVEVKVAPGCTATSLRGGYLQKCSLFNYEFAKHLNPNYQGSDSMLLGHALVSAEGTVLAGLNNSDGDNSFKQGRIWNGGKSKVDQPLGLIMNTDKQFTSLTGIVTERINETFQLGPRGVSETRIADLRDRTAIALRVPPQYKLNLPRYLRVVRMIPLRNSADAPAADPADRRSYRQRLGADLLDPTRTVVAAIRLEALGTKSIPALKIGLENQNALVRFCSAEALAYVGSPSAGEELARSVLEQPLFRAFGLAALASLDEAVCQVKLRDILLTATDDETRFGAFRALQTLNERNPAVRGELLNDSFWLHRVAPGSLPLVHVSTTRRAEIVLFGQEPVLKPPFSFLAGEFAVTATEDEDRCMVSRFPPRSAPVRKSCAANLEAVIRAMAEEGALYPEVVALLQQANSCGSLSCRVRVDALPQAATVYDLVKLGQGKSDDLGTIGQDPANTPTLYAAPSTPKPQPNDNAEKKN